MRAFRRILAAILLLLAIPGVCPGQERVSFSGIDLGSDVRTFSRELKKQGFKPDIERNGEDDPIYGVCREFLFTGEISGIPAEIHLTASRKTHTVFRVRVVLRHFIDREEASETAERIIPELTNAHPLCTAEELNYGMLAMPEMSGGKGRVTSYLSIPAGGLIFRYYSSPDRMKPRDSFGSATLNIFQNMMGFEHFVEVRYFDIAASRIAEDESGKQIRNRPGKKALAVFIGNYPEDSGWCRLASRNDRDTVLDMLQSNQFRYRDIKVLEDSEATRDAIISALDELSANALPGDSIYVHFSCHGQQVTDLDGDEALRTPGDRFDEAIVPYDAAVAYGWNGYLGDKHITDDVLNGYFSKIQKKIGTNGTLLVVFDACHSGDLSRGGDGEDGPSFRGSYEALNLPLKLQNTKPAAPCEVTWVSISACWDFQTNFEVTVGGKTYGRLSYAVSKCLRRGMKGSELLQALSEEYSALPLPPRKCQTLQYHVPDRYVLKVLF